MQVNRDSSTPRKSITVSICKWKCDERLVYSVYRVYGFRVGNVRVAK